MVVDCLRATYVERIYHQLKSPDLRRLFLITCLMRQHGKCQSGHFLAARFASPEMETQTGGGGRWESLWDIVAARVECIVCLD